jgi:hypothetical protein
MRCGDQLAEASCESNVEKAVLSSSSRPFSAVMAATATGAAIRPYSMAEVPAKSINSVLNIVVSLQETTKGLGRTA